MVSLGAAILTVGNNNLSTQFTGTVLGAGVGGISKFGTGKLELLGNNQYGASGTTSNFISVGTLSGTTLFGNQGVPSAFGRGNFRISSEQYTSIHRSISKY